MEYEKSAPVVRVHTGYIPIVADVMGNMGLRGGGGADLGGTKNG